jgi:hypothetical protein
VRGAAVHKISDGALRVDGELSGFLLAVALLAAVQAVMHINFFISLALGGVLNLLVGRGLAAAKAAATLPHAPAAPAALSVRERCAAIGRRPVVWYAGAGLVLAAAVGALALFVSLSGWPTAADAGIGLVGSRSLGALFALGLLAGLLTFGGAYTAIPFVQQDVVVKGAWMLNQQFLDGIAIAQVIPVRFRSAPSCVCVSPGDSDRVCGGRRRL